jgi:transposase-like protein
MVTTYGVLSFWLPRVVCECGGSVTIPFSMLQPYQRLWDDVVAQVVRWAEVGLSLRQMQTAIGDQWATQIGLRKLNQITQAVELPSAIELTSVPPIILLDAIWVTLLADTQTTQPDRLQRQRQVKAKQKVCVVVALGLYPQSGRWGILGWHVDHAESQAAWEALLLPLEQRGLYRQRGVELFIHDGGKGLIAALDLLYPTVPHQRCVFHKLRNLWHSIQTPAGLTPDQRRQLRLEILQPAQAIFYAASEKDAVGIQHALIEQFQHTQPQFVATLQRDWHDTIAFFRVLRRFPDWQRTALRTTSLLERVNRMLRRLFRPKGSFHSVTGLLSTLSRVLNPLRLF